MATLQKAATGIAGLDEIIYGGLPRNRSTLVCGHAGCGKTVLGIEFIVNGAMHYDEPGVFLSIEETEDDLRKNIASFGHDLEKLEKEKKVCIECININSKELFTAGQFDLSALFIRIDEAIKKVNAKRIVVDTYELIFNDIKDETVFRRELARLINWLKNKNMTSIFTSESSQGKLTKLGIEEFITDCVITLKQTVIENVYTRRLHILKYRGSGHGSNEYPFIINEKGIAFLPITSPWMPTSVSSTILSTGIKDLDEKVEKNGFYKGTTTLISGTAGTGKTTLTISCCTSVLKDHQKAIIFSFEESPAQIKRNMKSLGFDLEEYENQGLLKIIATRPAFHGLETHLMAILDQINDFQPAIVAFDPANDLIEAGTASEVKNLLLRLIDKLRSEHISTILTTLIGQKEVHKQLGISSMVDNWIHLEDIEQNHFFNHGIHIVKARGMNIIRKRYILNFSTNGLSLSDFE
jgi:circadian clock protein KaiC